MLFVGIDVLNFNEVWSASVFHVCRVLLGFHLNLYLPQDPKNILMFSSGNFIVFPISFMFDSLQVSSFYWYEEEVKIVCSNRFHF